MNEPLSVIPNHSGWPLKSLSSISTLVRRGTAPVYVESSEVYAIGQRCVTLTDFNASSARPHSARAMSRVLEPKSGDVLINSTGTGTIGRSVIFNDESRRYIVDGHVTVIRPAQHCAEAQWINEALRTPWFQKYLESHCYSGSTNQIELSLSALASAPIAVPPVAEQRRIAQILDSVDEQVRSTKETITKLHLVQRGIMQELLTRGIDESGKLRDPSLNPDQFRATKIGPLPISWKLTTIGENFDIKAGITLGPHRRPRRDASRYLRVANVRRSAVDLADVAMLQATAVERQEYVLRTGDLLCVEGHADVNEIGRCARVQDTGKGLLYQNHLFRLRSSSIDSVFGESWLNSNYAKAYWRATCSTSSGLNTINSKQLKAMLCVIPTMEEQQRIAGVIVGQQNRIDTEMRALMALREMKQGLVADLLTGRIGVSTGVKS